MSAGIEASSTDALLSALSQHAKKDDVNLGQVVCFGLDDLKKRISQKNWEAIRGLLDSLVRKAISQFCDAKDIYMRCRDGSFVIIFQTERQDIAEAKAAKISKFVNEALFGSDSTNSLTIQTTVQNCGELAKNAGRTADEILTGFVNGSLKMDLGAAPKEEGTTSAAAPKEGTTEEVKSRNHSVDQQKMDDIVSALHSKSTEYRNLLQEQFEQFDNEPVSFQFEPIWSVHYSKVATFHCRPVRRNLFGGKPVSDYSVLGSDPSTKAIIELDIVSLEHALVAQCRNLRGGSRQHLSANLHFETLANSTGRSQLLDLLKSLPEPVRAMVTLHLIGVPEGIPETRLTELTRSISHYISGMSATLLADNPRNTQRALQRLKSAGVGAALICPARTDFEESVGQMSQFAETTSRFGLVPGAYDINDVDMSMRLAYGGFDLLMGSVLGGVFETLPKPYKFTISDLESARGKTLHSDTTPPPTMGRAQSTV